MTPVLRRQSRAGKDLQKANPIDGVCGACVMSGLTVVRTVHLSPGRRGTWTYLMGLTESEALGAMKRGEPRTGQCRVRVACVYHVDANWVSQGEVVKEVSRRERELWENLPGGMALGFI